MVLILRSPTPSEILQVYSLKEVLEINQYTEEEILELLVEEGHVVLPVIWILIQVIDLNVGR